MKGLFTNIYDFSFGFWPEYSRKCKAVSADVHSRKMEHMLHKEETPRASAEVLLWHACLYKDCLIKDSWLPM